MKHPYGLFLLLSIGLSVLWFCMEDRPPYISLAEDMSGILFYGAIYTVLLFALFSGIYLAVKKQR